MRLQYRRPKFSRMFAGFALLLAGRTASAQKLVSAQAPATATFDMLAHKALASGKAAGFSLAVQWKGKSYFLGSYGLADVDKGVPVSAETRFAIGSVSKQFTAVSVLQLADQGKLSLDNVLAKYLPNLPNADRITLRMLLNQTSGLHNYPNTTEHDWPKDGAIPGDKLATVMSTDKPDFPPGTRFAYSNTNYFALATVVAQVSGESFDEYLSQHIFRPLGMTKSGNGFAAQHGLAVPVGGQGDPRRPNSLDLYEGAGSVVSTAADLLRWDQALMDGRLLKPESMHLLWAAGRPATGTSTYAMGFVTASIQAIVRSGTTASRPPQAATP